MTLGSNLPLKTYQRGSLEQINNPCELQFLSHQKEDISTIPQGRLIEIMYINHRVWCSVWPTAGARQGKCYFYMDGWDNGEKGTPQGETISSLSLKSLLVLFSVCLTMFDQDIKTRLLSEREVAALRSERSALLPQKHPMWLSGQQKPVSAVEQEHCLVTS